MLKKELDVFEEKSDFYDIYYKLKDEEIPLSKKQLNRLEKFKKKKTLTESQINENETYCFCGNGTFHYRFKNRSFWLVSFVQKYNGLLLYRIFAIRRLLDRRKKENKQTFTTLEMYYCIY